MFAINCVLCSDISPVTERAMISGATKLDMNPMPNGSSVTSVAGQVVMSNDTKPRMCGTDATNIVIQMTVVVAVLLIPITVIVVVVVLVRRRYSGEAAARLIISGK